MRTLSLEVTDTSSFDKEVGLQKIKSPGGVWIFRFINEETNLLTTLWRIRE